MPNKTRPADNAFPHETIDGLTKREYFAALALQGLLANPQPSGSKARARSAVLHADALIEALNTPGESEE